MKVHPCALTIPHKRSTSSVDRGGATLHSTVVVSPEQSSSQHNQPYDASLKDWISQQAATILPLLFPNIVYEQTINVRALALRDALVDIVDIKFPELVDYASQQAHRFNTPETLHLLIQQIKQAPDANAARALLKSGPQQ